MNRYLLRSRIVLAASGSGQARNNRRMRYRALGRTDLKVSEISLGCSGFWGNRSFSDNKAIAVVREAFERGINFFDTGHNYCNYNAEPRLGKAIKQILTCNDRSKVIISSKAGTVKPTRSQTNRQNTNFTPDYIESTCAKSIKNLNCGYLDVFQLHSIHADEITEPLLQRLALMRQHGMFRYLGINTHIESDMIFVSKHPDVFDMALIDLNVLQLDRLPIVASLHHAGIGVMVGTVLGQGHLIKGKIGTIRSAADLWYLARASLNLSGRKLAKHSAKMRSVLSQVTEMSPAQAAVSFVLENPAVASCIFGTTSLPNLREIVDAPGRQLSNANRRAIWIAYESQSAKISQ